MFILRRIFSTSSIANAMKTARTAANFTFSTKFPKRSKPNTSGARTNRTNKPKSIGLAIPARFRLAPLQNQDSKAQIGRRKSLAIKRKRLDKVVDGKVEVKKSIIRTRDQLKIDKKTLEVQKKREAHSTKFSLVVPEKSKDVVTTTEWSKMGLEKSVLTAINKGLGFQNASQVQATCIPTALKEQHRNILLGSQTGSGKTVAYLVPLFHYLKKQEAEAEIAVSNSKAEDFDMIESMDGDGGVTKSGGLELFRKSKRPRAIVLVPSRQLIDQISSVAKSMTHYSRLRVVGIF